MLIAPAFTWLSVDIVGQFKIKCACGSNHQATAKGWNLVLCCPSTNAVSAEVMETLSTASAGYQQGGIRVTVVPAGDHSADGVAERAIKTI